MRKALLRANKHYERKLSMPEFFGIDVSKYQPQVNWKDVKAAGKNFAFIRLGWAGWAGELNIDSMAHSHIKAAKAAGVNVGVYVYSYCKNVESAKLAAQRTIAEIKAYDVLEYPIAFDIEDTSESGTPYQKLGKSLNTSIVTAFLNEIELAGYYGILYTYKSFAENYLNMADLNKYDLWLAQYANTCTYAGQYSIWQYAGDSGRCNGVTGACDLNISYKDYAAVIRNTGLNGYAKKSSSGSSTTELEAVKAENASLRAEVASLERKLGDISNILTA